MAGGTDIRCILEMAGLRKHSGRKLHSQPKDRGFELGNGGIHLGINYSVSNEMKQNE